MLGSCVFECLNNPFIALFGPSYVWSRGTYKYNHNFINFSIGVCLHFLFVALGWLGFQGSCCNNGPHESRSKVLSFQYTLVLQSSSYAQFISILISHSQLTLSHDLDYLIICFVFPCTQYAVYSYQLPLLAFILAINVIILCCFSFWSKLFSKIIVGICETYFFSFLI